MAGYDPDIFAPAVAASGPSYDSEIFTPARQLMPEPIKSSAPSADGTPAAARLLRNIPRSTMQFVGGLANAAMHPLDTATTLLDVGAGGLRNLTPEFLRTAIDKLDFTPAKQDAQRRATQTANALGQVYKDRYGSLEQAGNTLVEDPIGAVSDLSAVLGFGAALTPGKFSNALSTASRYTNPLSAVAPAAKAVGFAGKHLLGLSTGAGQESVAQAFNAGRVGDKTFWNQLSGNSNIGEVLDQAKLGLQNMKAEKSAQYQSSMQAIRTDKSVLAFDKIDDALRSAASKVTFNGVPKNERAATVIGQMADDVAAWKARDPAVFHTPEGMDALKQRLGGILESVSPQERTSRMVAGEIYNSVKDSIAAQAPTYAKTMKQYSDALDQIKEIEKTFSLGPGGKFTQDTAIRKLQSVMRNNVNTNYGNRLSLAQELESKGNVSLRPALAGQAMNTWLSRGLGGQLQNMATLGTATVMQNPAIAALLPLQSPKAVGATLYGLGNIARGADRAGGLLGSAGLTADQAKLAGLLGAKLAQPELLTDW